MVTYMVADNKEEEELTSALTWKSNLVRELVTEGGWLIGLTQLAHFLSFFLCFTAPLS